MERDQLYPALSEATKAVSASPNST